MLGILLDQVAERGVTWSKRGRLDDIGGREGGFRKRFYG